METTKEKAEVNFKITGDWHAQSKKLKEKYSQLTDEDLKFEPGKEEALLTKLQSRLNKNREEVIAIIKHVQPAKV